MTQSSDALRQYLERIGQVPLLDAADERALAGQIELARNAQRRIEAGEDSTALRRAVREGEAAKDRFIRANLRLVVSVAKRYPVPPGMELLDLIQEGNVGLERAVEKFDGHRGFKFSTYASFWIRQAIGRALDQKGSLIHVPADRAVRLRAALRASSETGEALAGEFEELRRLTSAASLDQPTGADSDVSLGDLLADDADGPEDAALERQQADLAVGLLDALDDRPRRAVELRMGLVDGRSRTFREVGQELDVTPEAARRLVQRALVVLRLEAAAFGLAA